MSTNSLSTQGMEVSYKKESNLLSECSRFYQKLLKDFEDCSQQDTKCQNINLENVSQFLSWFDHHSIKETFVKKLTHKEDCFEEYEKAALNCLCLSVNIFNLLMETVTDEYIGKLFDYLNTFSQHFESSPVAKRMTEAILYCLCNYCNEKLDREKKLITLTNENIDDLKKCFEQSRSEKMKLGSAIVSCFLVSIDFDFVTSSREYLRNIQDKCETNKAEEYLGIKQQLIRRSVIGAKLETYNRVVEYGDLCKAQAEELNEKLERIEEEIEDMGQIGEDIEQSEDKKENYPSMTMQVEGNCQRDLTMINDKSSVKLYFFDFDGSPLADLIEDLKQQTISPMLGLSLIFVPIVLSVMHRLFS